MKLLELNINKYLLLENVIFKDPNNNIDDLNRKVIALTDPYEQLSLLNIATDSIEKFHSFFHFEQSFFHLQLAIALLAKKKVSEAKTQLELAIFQDHVNNQAIALLNSHETKPQSYERPFKSFKEYLKFATNEDQNPLEEIDYWKKSVNIENFEHIIERIRYLHLNYHQESAKLYLNRALIFYKLNQYDLSKNDLVKANNLDNNLKEKEYYLDIILQMSTEVVLGLGSNLGDRLNYLQQAIKKLEELKILTKISSSSIEETKAVLKPNSPAEWNLNFLNMAVKGFTNLSPKELIHSIQKIEHLLGRNSTQEWSPREIDIDILSYGDKIIELENLTIPHSELLNRQWALKPFVELNPEWKYPVEGPFYNLKIKDIYEKI